MYPHRIRLRGPWEVEAGSTETSAPARVPFPAVWSDLKLGTWTGPLVLRRRFGYPGRIDADERVWLVGEGVEGPIEFHLQGSLVATIDRERFAVEVTDRLGPRNVLEARLDAAPGRTRLWDDIALEIRATAYLEDVSLGRDDTGALTVEGRVVGTSSGPLEVYVLADGRSCGYRQVHATPEGTRFRISLESTGTLVRVELVHVSQVWYVVELPGAGPSPYS